MTCADGRKTAIASFTSRPETLSRFFSNTITGNGGTSVFCDARSLAIGNLRASPMSSAGRIRNRSQSCKATAPYPATWFKVLNPSYPQKTRCRLEARAPIATDADKGNSQGDAVPLPTISLFVGSALKNNKYASGARPDSCSRGPGSVVALGCAC